MTQKETGPALGRFPEILRTYSLMQRKAASPERTPVPVPGAVDGRHLEGTYGANAHRYYAAGWQPIPLVPQRKIPPKAARGFTGREGRLIDWQLMDKSWVGDYPHFNIGVRAAGWVGIDVDAYDGRHGATTLAAAQDVIGPLPATWSSTSRGAGHSRIHFYRIPTGLVCAGLERAIAGLVDTAEPGLEVVHFGHRYAVVSPSVHPDRSSGVRRYSWYAPDLTLSKAPRVTDLARLPESWVEFIRAVPEPRATARELATPPEGPAEKKDADDDLFDPASDDRSDTWAGGRLLHHIAAIKDAGCGSVNNTLNRSGFMLGQLAEAGFFSADEALGAALEAVAAGGVHSDAWNRSNGRSWTARGVLISAINAGLECPRFAREGHA